MGRNYMEHRLIPYDNGFFKGWQIKKIKKALEKLKGKVDEKCWVC